MTTANENAGFLDHAGGRVLDQMTNVKKRKRNEKETKKRREETYPNLTQRSSLSISDHDHDATSDDQ